MNLFDIYEDLEKVVKFYTNPKTTSNYSAFCDLNDFQDLCLNYIARGIAKLNMSFNDQMQILKEDKYISEQCFNDYYKYHNNDKQSIEDIFAYTISLYLETIICFCNVASDPVNKYLNYSKLGNLTRYLIDDLVAFGFNRKILMEKSGFNKFEDAL